MTQLLPADVALPKPPPGGTRLIVLPNDRQAELTLRCETDCRTALTRGVKEYLEQLEMDWHDGKRVRLVKVKQTWAEPEVLAEYPSAAVYAVGSGDYDQSGSLSPSVKRLSDGTTYTEPAEYTVQIVVDVFCTDPLQRVAIGKMLEDAFDPVEWMSGFRLELPHYHGVRATFEKTQSQYMDTELDAQRKLRRQQFLLNGKVGQIRVLGKRPALQVRTQVEAYDHDAEMPDAVNEFG